MPKFLRDSDLEMFNHGDMTMDDFESGDFGILQNIDGQEGEYVNLMAQGIMTKDGLKVKNVAVLGGGSPMDKMDMMESESESPNKKALDQITKGEERDE